MSHDLTCPTFIVLSWLLGIYTTIHYISLQWTVPRRQPCSPPKTDKDHQGCQQPLFEASTTSVKTAPATQYPFVTIFSPLGPRIPLQDMPFSYSMPTPLCKDPSQQTTHVLIFNRYPVGQLVLGVSADSW